MSTATCSRCRRRYDTSDYDPGVRLRCKCGGVITVPAGEPEELEPIGAARRADEIDYRIIGDDLQGVEVTLDKGESVWAQPGAMRYMTRGIKMEAETGGGILKGVKRAIAGERFFIARFTCTRGRGKVCFGAPAPGRVLALDLAETGAVLCQRGAFLCAARGVNLKVALTRRLGAGLVGGEGFILQKLTGDGLAFVHACGALETIQLGKKESIRVDTGCLVAMGASVDFDVQTAGGIKTSLFGGEGFFLARLTGPGTVHIQTLPLARLARNIFEHHGGES